jgi:hypothetical protein
MPQSSKSPTDVELRFNGDPTLHMRGVPARDLTRADVDRLVYRRTVPGPGIRGLNRGQRGFQAARNRLVRELLTTGKFEKER